MTSPENGSSARDRMTIGIVGLGYVGLPLAVAFAEIGDEVVGVDTDASKIESLRSGVSYVEDISSERLAAASERITATTDPAGLSGADAILICVPTPLTPNREPDMGPLLASAATVRDVMRQGQVVVLESTTWPGTTRELLVPILEESGLVAGRDFAVAFSPERVDPGREDYTTRTTPKVLGGLTEGCADRATAVYERICDRLVRVSTPEAAELSKLLENIFRSVNIALVNEMAVMAQRMGIDIWEVVDAASTKPYGFMRFEPGPGMGGHCLPVDPFYLTWKAREYDFATEFIELAGKVNQNMPYHCVDRIEWALNERSKPVRGARIALIGVSYKAGIGDLREAPALKIIARLQASGAELRYHDPYVPDLPQFGLRSEELDAVLDGSDAVVILTAHPDIDWAGVVERAGLVVDFRGVTRAIRRPNLVRL